MHSTSITQSLHTSIRIRGYTCTHKLKQINPENLYGPLTSPFTYSDVGMVMSTEVGLIIVVWRFLRPFELAWQLMTKVTSLQSGWPQIWLDHLVSMEAKACFSFWARVSFTPSQKEVEMLGYARSITSLLLALFCSTEKELFYQYHIPYNQYVHMYMYMIICNTIYFFHRNQKLQISY